MLLSIAIAATVIAVRGDAWHDESMGSDRRRATAEFAAALEQLSDMAQANIARSEEVRRRIDHLLAAIAAGEDLPAVVEAEERPLIPELLTENIEALHEVGSLLRRTEAAALRAHGYTMERIAEIFGVTRQRISALLKDVA